MLLPSSPFGVTPSVTRLHSHVSGWRLKYSCLQLSVRLNMKNSCFHFSFSHIKGWCWCEGCCTGQCELKVLSITYTCTIFWAGGIRAAIQDCSVSWSSKWPVSPDLSKNILLHSWYSYSVQGKNWFELPFFSIWLVFCFFLHPQLWIWSLISGISWVLKSSISVCKQLFLDIVTHNRCLKCAGILESSIKTFTNQCINNDLKNGSVESLEKIKTQYEQNYCNRLQFVTLKAHTFMYFTYVTDQRKYVHNCEVEGKWNIKNSKVLLYNCLYQKSVLILLYRITAVLFLSLKKVTPQNDAATTMFHRGDGVFRKMCSDSFPPQTVFFRDVRKSI